MYTYVVTLRKGEYKDAVLHEISSAKNIQYFHRLNTHTILLHLTLLSHFLQDFLHIQTSTRSAFLFKSVKMLINIPRILALLSATAAVASASSFGVIPNDPASGLSNLQVRANCGPTNGRCDKNGCAGINDPVTGAGVCTAGDFAGCPCANICGSTNGKCNGNNCGGLNDPAGGPGICTTSSIAGCACDSICGSQPGPCNKNGCEGLNAPGGQFGYCTKGEFAGCLCTSVCGDHDGSCDSNGCAGKNGFCTSGGLKGCPCGGQCGNLESKSCSDNGCNGVNLPDEGFGICTGAFKGCACLLTCGPTPGSCSKNGCNGANGKCTAGAFNGCSCV